MASCCFRDGRPSRDIKRFGEIYGGEAWQPAPLLEKLVADILVVCSEHPDVAYSRVTVDKPHALRFADSVSLTLDYRPEQAGSMRLLEKAS